MYVRLLNVRIYFFPGVDWVLLREMATMGNTNHSVLTRLQCVEKHQESHLVGSQCYIPILHSKTVVI